MSADKAIEVVDLVKTYGSFNAVSNLNLSINDGEFMGLLGPNGSGKSTTLKSITGLIKPTSGTIRIQGVDIKNHKRAMAHTGCVIETPEPYSDYTPQDLMEHVGRMYGLSNDEIKIRARDVLEEMKMWDWRYKKIGGFSKGMRQRCILAQALLPNPQVILLDEPTSGLDPRGMIEVRQVLAELKKRERTLLISTHILKEVSEICGSVTMIRDGKAVISGEVSKLIEGVNALSTIEIKVLDEITEKFVKDLSGCEGVTGYDKMSPHVIRLEFNGTSEQQADLVEKAFKGKLRLLSVNEHGADLESLYMELTQNSEVS